MGEVILVASGKGGVGKTSFVANGGVVLSQMGYKVLLIDMNMGLRNLDIYLGIESKVVYDIADVLTGMCRVKQATVKDRKEAHFLSIVPDTKIHKVAVGSTYEAKLSFICLSLRTALRFR